VFTSGGTDYSYYDACGNCNDWDVCQATSGLNICIKTCAVHTDCFAFFDSIRGRQYNGGCDIQQKICHGFMLQSRLSGTLNSDFVQIFRDYAIGKGIVVDSKGIVTDWGPGMTQKLVTQGFNVSSFTVSSSSNTSSTISLFHHFHFFILFICGLLFSFLYFS